MEVHHHPDLHHKRKPWKEYFLEFIMIFLAVTLGFFAETMRESISENQKATELAKSLYQEVYADSVNMQSKIKLRREKAIQMQYFRNYVSDSSLTHVSDKFNQSFEWSFILTSSILFEPNEGILTQLRNSGTLRYFKSIRLQNAISRINIVNANVRNRNGQEYTFIESSIRPFSLKHFDFKWQDEFTQNGKLSIPEALSQTNFHSTRPPSVRNLKDFKRGDADALAGYYLLIVRSTVQIYYAPFIKANHELLEALRMEYHFNGE
ncbi:MAG: hypothetical protein JWP94_2524 [Mucilaginibacter sp.]|nr:hypothetical protein [Mucilaginibacter sp.]